MMKWWYVVLTSCALVAEENAVYPSAGASVAGETVATIEPMEWQVAEDTGLTTSLLDNRGNWYNKQRILAEARKSFETVRSVVNAIDTFVRELMEQRNQLLSTTAQFYIDLGTTEAALSTRINVIIEALKKEETAGTLSEQERADLQQFLTHKTAIEELVGLLTKVQAYDDALNKAVQVLSEQLSVAHSYEEIAWENYDKIADVLNDEIADGYYKQVLGSQQNVEAIQNYLIREFAPYFANITEQLKQTTQLITTQVQDLQKQGLALIEEFQSREEQPEPVVKPEPVKMTWWQSLLAFVSGIRQTIFSLFKGLFGL
jgi:hypothetical protein